MIGALMSTFAAMSLLLYGLLSVSEHICKDYKILRTGTQDNTDLIREES